MWRKLLLVCLPVQISLPIVFSTLVRNPPTQSPLIPLTLPSTNVTQSTSSSPSNQTNLTFFFSRNSNHPPCRRSPPPQCRPHHHHHLSTHTHSRTRTRHIANAARGSYERENRPAGECGSGRAAGRESQPEEMVDEVEVLVVLWEGEFMG